MLGTAYSVATESRLRMHGGNDRCFSDKGTEILTRDKHIRYKNVPVNQTLITNKGIINFEFIPGTTAGTTILPGSRCNLFSAYLPICREALHLVIFVQIQSNPYGCCSLDG